MISKHESQIIALREIELQKSYGATGELVIFDTIETPIGFIYEWGKESFLKTEDLNHIIIGATPFLVDHEDGTIHHISARTSYEGFIADYKDKKTKGEL